MTKANSTAPGSVQKLSTTECWRLLESSTLGRLAVEGRHRSPDLFPVNYLVHSGSVYLRSGPGSKLMDVAARPAVAFEIDGEDPLSHWSVVIKGSAARLDSDAEIEESGITGLVTAHPTQKHDFIRITPTSVTGRRFRKPAADRPVRAPEPAAPRGDARPAAPGTGPIAIAHYPPRPTH